jgi:hypothetical protein
MSKIQIRDDKTRSSSSLLSTDSKEGKDILTDLPGEKV